MATDCTVAIRGYQHIAAIGAQAEVIGRMDAALGQRADARTQTRGGNAATQIEANAVAGRRIAIARDAHAAAAAGLQVRIDGRHAPGDRRGGAAGDTDARCAAAAASGHHRHRAVVVPRAQFNAGARGGCAIEHNGPCGTGVDRAAIDPVDAHHAVGRRAANGDIAATRIQGVVVGVIDPRVAKVHTAPLGIVCAAGAGITQVGRGAIAAP